MNPDIDMANIGQFIGTLRDKGVATVTWRTYYEGDEDQFESLNYRDKKGKEVADPFPDWNEPTWAAHRAMWDLQELITNPGRSYDDSNGEYTLNVNTLEVTKFASLWLPEPEIQEERLRTPATLQLNVPGIGKREEV